MNEFAIRVKHLEKMYKLYNKPSDRLRETLGLRVPVKEHYALKDVSFDVKRGETVGIIGTNGSGKSTILKIITGVLNPVVGALVHNAGSVIVIIHSAVLLRWEYRPKP